MLVVEFEHVRLIERIIALIEQSSYIHMHCFEKSEFTNCYSCHKKNINVAMDDSTEMMYCIDCLLTSWYSKTSIFSRRYDNNLLY